uniref:Integrase_H2C2 domain-containing protein n=1 Tax=Syphacia muris TaxID=451379 RepID=A0A0N5AR08_9BILA
MKRRAEIMLIKEAQKDLTREEIERWDLRTDEDGIWRMSGRFGLQRSQDRLIYLPRKHPIVTLLIRKVHKVCGHFGIAYTLAEFKTHY